MLDLKINLILSQPVNSRTNGNFSHPKFGKTPDIEGDKVEISNKKQPLEKKTIIISGIILSIVSGVTGFRLHKANYIKRAQKTFQEVFMRDSITKDETVKMLKRYKEISKIKDKDEYIKALFEETKKNYGFEKGCLELKTFASQEHPTCCGFVNKGKHFVNINKDRKSNEIMNTIHHEMKHKQQEYMMMNYCGNIEEFLCRTSPVSTKKGELGVDFIEELKKDYPKWFEQFNLKELDKKNVPEKYKDYVEHLLKDVKTYQEGCVENGTVNKEYYDNFLEVDARNAGSKISKLLRWFIPV